LEDTLSPNGPTPLNAEFMRLLMPLRKPGDGTELANAAAAATLAVGVAYALLPYVELCDDELVDELW
jgi:hypothetical protein